jgi:hypothetical protein
MERTAENREQAAANRFVRGGFFRDVFSERNEGEQLGGNFR